MNMKPIDLQMAIPKATEVGRVQQQMQQKPQQDQALLQQENLKSSEKSATKPTEVDKSDKDPIRDEEKRKEEQQQKKRAKAYSKNEKQKEAEMAEHPYKGKNIDLSL